MNQSELREFVENNPKLVTMRESTLRLNMKKVVLSVAMMLSCVQVYAGYDQDRYSEALHVKEEVERIFAEICPPSAEDSAKGYKVDPGTCLLNAYFEVWESNENLYQILNTNHIFDYRMSASTADLERLRIQAEEEKVEEDRYRARQQAIEQEKARLASLPGVRIGMTSDEVLNHSNWGTPDDINLTITVQGTFEQWVYGYSNFLYFTNGILTTIQN